MLHERGLHDGKRCFPACSTFSRSKLRASHRQARTWLATRFGLASWIISALCYVINVAHSWQTCEALSGARSCKCAKNMSAIMSRFLQQISPATAPFSQASLPMLYRYSELNVAPSAGITHLYSSSEYTAVQEQQLPTAGGGGCPSTDCCSS